MNRTIIKVVFVILLAVVVGTVGSRGTREDSNRPASPLATLLLQAPLAPERKPSLEELRHQAVAKAAPHFDWADRECERLVDESLVALQCYFASVRKGTPQFAEVALGWGSKWRFVADRLPFIGGYRHEEYLRAAFREHLLTPEDLEAQIRRLVQNYVDSVRSVEDQTLIRIRLDIVNLSPGLLVGQIDEGKLRAIFAAAMTKAAEHTGASLREDVAQQVIGLVVGEVLTQAAVRLGVSAGVLGTGAATSWATAGASILIGICVDQIISWGWDQLADPTGHLAREMDAKIAQLHKAIVDGTTAAPGLRQRLDGFASERVAVRRAIILEVVQREDGR